MAEFIKNPQNTYIFGLLALFVTMYGPRLSPKLPEPIQNLFEHAWFRGAIMFLAVYMAQHDVKVSLVVTIVFMVLMNFVQNSNLFETFLQNYEKNMEGFYSCDPNSESCGTTVEISDEQHQTLKQGEIDCINSINNNFKCDSNNGSPLSLSPGQVDATDCSPSENVTKEMLDYASQLANSGGKSGVGVNIAGKINTNVCSKVNSLPETHPNKEKLQQACTELTDTATGKCVPALWNSQNQGKSITLPDLDPFYQGPCANIDQDSQNLVYYRPQCFDKKPNGTCSGKSKDECKENNEDCFWRTDNGVFSDTTVTVKNDQDQDVKLKCMAQEYNNSGISCQHSKQYETTTSKNAPNAYKPCVKDIQLDPNNPSRLIEPSGEQCYHSGQCCKFRGDRPNGVGSHCLKKTNQCVSLDMSNSKNFSESWGPLASVLNSKKIIDDNQTQLNYSDVGGAEWDNLFASTNRVEPTWTGDTQPYTGDKNIKGLDWENVYYGDTSSKTTNENSPSFPNQLFVKDNSADGSNLGMGCWVPSQKDVSEGSEWVAKVGPNLITTQQEQLEKKESGTLNYQSGYGVIENNKGEAFVGHQKSMKKPKYNQQCRSSHGLPVNNCCVYNANELKFVGAAFYPIGGESGGHVIDSS